MLKRAADLLLPDPYYAGTAGFVGSNIEQLHGDMACLDLPDTVPEELRRVHAGIRHAYIYSYFSYDLLTLSVGQLFPCLGLALRLRIGKQFEERVDRKGKARPPVMLPELLEAAKAQQLITFDISWINHMRKSFAHGSDAVLNPPLALPIFEAVTEIIIELFSSRATLPEKLLVATFDRTS